jgi:hypothetical protein
VSDTGNYIEDFLRGRAMAMNPEYAKRVYHERDMATMQSAMPQLEQSLVVQSDLPRLRAIAATKDPVLLKDYIKETYPSKNDFRTIQGTDGQVYSFDAKRDSYHTLPGVFDPRYQVGLQTDLAAGKARAYAMNKLYKVKYGDGSEDYLSGSQLEQANAQGVPYQVLEEMPQQGYAPQQSAQQGQPQPNTLDGIADQAQQKYNTYMQQGQQPQPQQGQVDGMSDEQQKKLNAIMGMYETGQMSVEEVDQRLKAAGIDVQQESAPAPQAVPLDTGDGLQRPVVEPQPQPQPQSMSIGRFGQTAADKATIADTTAQRQVDTDLAKKRNEAKLNLPTIDSAYNQTYNKVLELKNHTAKNAVVGMPESFFGLTSKFGIPSATDEYDFKTRLNQLENVAFLNGYNILRGGGQISNIEGGKATGALLRAVTSTSEKDFDKALDDMLVELSSGREAAYKKAGEPLPKSNVPATTSSVSGKVSASGRLKVLE